MTRGYDPQKKQATLLMKINDKSIRIKLDTGAELNVMSTQVISQIANAKDVEQSNVKPKGYGGSAIPVTEVSFIRCAYNNIYKDVKFYLQRCDCQIIKQNRPWIRIMSRFRVNQNYGEIKH